MNHYKEMLNMRKQIKKMVGSLLAVGLVVGLTTGANATAASTDTGAADALTHTDYTLEKMLTYAIEDEYLAQAEYKAIMEAYGVQKPLSNIIKAEATHIALLTPLFKEYGAVIPEKDWDSLVTVPVSLVAAYEIGVKAEENNIAMYESFLQENLPGDVREVFERLMNASEKHLAAFQRQTDGSINGNSNVNGNGKISGNGKGNANGSCDGMQRGKTNNSVGGNGQGNRSSSQESCILQ